MEIKRPLNTDAANDETQSDTYLVDQVLEQAKAQAGTSNSVEEIEFEARLSAMKHEVERLSESVGLLSESVKELALQAPSIAEERLRQAIRTAPLSAALYAVTATFLVTRYLFRN